MHRSIPCTAFLLCTVILHSASAADLTCFGLDPNDPGVCGGHGTCIDLDTCLCELGWFGPDCSMTQTWDCFGIASDDPNVCSGRGTCIAADTCQCSQPWAGPECGLCYYSLKADLNSDCVVDLIDLAELASVWLVSCIDDPTNPECLIGS